MTKEKKAQGGEEGKAGVVTIERINALVDVIVPLQGCEGEGSDAVALALAELVGTLTNPKTEYAQGEDAAWLAYHATRRAYDKTDASENALKEWARGRFVSVLEEGGAE